MPTKLDRKTLPAGTAQTEFKYMGRPASDQGDFGTAVGIADCACVNQFGESEGSSSNNSKYYHGGVVQHTPSGKWYLYTEWGRIKPGKSWNGHFNGGDYQFVECSSEEEARKAFASQMAEKNTKRLSQKSIGGRLVWAAKEGKDGYLVQRLATRERGLPDAYTIKDSTGVVTASAVVSSVTPSTKTFHPAVVSLAKSLVGGTRDYSRAAAASTGITPTMDAINDVRDNLIPAALQILASVGPDLNKQVKNRDLIDLSKLVATIVPRPIPHGGDPMAILLTSANILSIQQDLDAFEGALQGEDFSLKTDSGTDPDTLLNAQLRWIDQTSDEGKWLLKTYMSMTNNRHGYLAATPKILNVFAVTRPDRDAKFLSEVQKIATKRKGYFSLKAGLQPASRIDLGAEAVLYREANVIFSQHGTRSVNVSPILQTTLKLPRSLANVPLQGSNFGHGIYVSTDRNKAAGYSSLSNAVWSGGGGGVQSRGAFMFLCDSIMGDAYRAPSTGSWTSPPDGKDSIFGVGGDRGHSLSNDEHILFSSDHVRIRYLVEFTQ